MCCEKADCDVAFMPQNHCYAVSCYSDEHCETTPASVSNFVVQLVKVRRVTIPDPYNESPKEEDIWKSGNQASSKENLNEEGKTLTRNVGARKSYHHFLFSVRLRFTVFF